ncbi:PAAR domain-containing protein, partial [Enterobacter cloacae]|nr:PAAR domain-containing protein [Enterobacter cloacae]MBJ6487846.1 PAAR domain-containing protein [Enterobacter cloacae]MBJ6521524.1 PAAR domain-containing protein [Enterobacter cloacae]MBK4607345.1 PAAR domain-containing protein [Enterobacter cloacae]MBK4655390.1 PAAR domain-containing protein [Enterobacter cloacae]
MGKHAARQTADTAGHDGPITSGSRDVSTGGLPSARMGDIYICKTHGPGVISEGSKTVTINGLPAARKGDKVVCGKKSLPPTQGPKPPEYHYVTIAKNTNEDGSVKNPNGSDKFKLYTAYAVSTLMDEDGDGQYDKSNLKAGIIDFQLNHPIGDSGANIGLGGTVGKAEMTAGTIANEDVHSSSIEAKLEGLSGNISLSSGKAGSGDYVETKAEGKIGLAEGKGNYNLTHDLDEARVGAAFELGAEAAAAKGQLSGIIESKYFKMTGSVDGTAGAAGLGLGGGG